MLFLKFLVFMIVTRFLFKHVYGPHKKVQWPTRAQQYKDQEGKL